MNAALERPRERGWAHQHQGYHYARLRNRRHNIPLVFTGTSHRRHLGRLVSVPRIRCIHGMTVGIIRRSTREDLLRRIALVRENVACLAARGTLAVSGLLLAIAVGKGHRDSRVGLILVVHPVCAELAHGRRAGRIRLPALRRRRIPRPTGRGVALRGSLPAQLRGRRVSKTAARVSMTVAVAVTMALCMASSRGRGAEVRVGLRCLAVCGGAGARDGAARALVAQRHVRAVDVLFGAALATRRRPRALWAGTVQSRFPAGRRDHSWLERVGGGEHKGARNVP